MEWNRSETLAMAAPRCARCLGLGRIRKGLEEAPCPCVLRAIFRACYKRFTECISYDLAATRASLERGATRDPGGPWGRRNEEFVADFLLVVKRTLSEEEHQIFRFHLLLGADWKMCCRRLNLGKGSFFNLLYRLQQKLGRTFRELEPYPLFPVREYFAPGLNSCKPATVVEMPSSRVRLDVPIRRAA
jgi:hypothetical protein